MTTIRTRKPTFCSSLTTTDAQGISFRYPLLDDKGNFTASSSKAFPPASALNGCRNFWTRFMILKKRATISSKRSVKSRAACIPSKYHRQQQCHHGLEKEREDFCQRQRAHSCPRRKRDREGVGGTGPAFSQFAGRQAFCDRQLRGVAP